MGLVRFCPAREKRNQFRSTKIGSGASLAASAARDTFWTPHPMVVAAQNANKFSGTVSVGRQSISPASAPLNLSNTSLIRSLSRFGDLSLLRLIHSSTVVASSSPPFGLAEATAVAENATSREQLWWANAPGGGS